MIKKIKRFLKHLLPKSAQKLIGKWRAYAYLNTLKYQIEKSKKTIVFLNHFFSQDYNAFRLENKKYNIIGIDPSRLFAFADLYFTEDVKALNAAYEGCDAKERANYRAECNSIFNKISDRFGFDLIITPADNYYWVRELIAVAKEKGVKTVVLDKEGIITPDSYESESRRIKAYAPVISDRVYVWSERQKEFWKKVGAAENIVRVVGQARSDLFFKSELGKKNHLFPSSRRTITFFTYEDDAYIPRSLVSSKGVNWKKMKRESHEVIKRLAADFQDCLFVIKCHPQQPDLLSIKSKFSGKNLMVVGGSETGSYLIRHSDIIIGFQTTALFESIMLNKNAIYTAWDENLEAIQENLLPFHKAPGLKRIGNSEELYYTVSRYLQGDENVFAEKDANRNQSIDFINHYFYSPDGRVCERIFDDLEDIFE